MVVKPSDLTLSKQHDRDNLFLNFHTKLIMEQTKLESSTAAAQHYGLATKYLDSTKSQHYSSELENSDPDCVKLRA